MQIAWEKKCFGGVQGVYRHASSATGTEMQFSVFVPPGPGMSTRHPVVTFLSGLTCTEENFTLKAGAQRWAAELGLVVVAPDTSPRGLDLPGEHEASDFGSGAGFYVDATRAPWSAHYRMFTYVTEELPALIADAFPVETERWGIMGHSMGGHGALVAALRRPERFGSVSAFAPIANPSDVPWGRKALSGYLGDDPETWRAWDASRLIEDGARVPHILVDQGTDDPFLAEQLRPDALRAACDGTGQPLELRMQPGYDHSYFTIATFIGAHLSYHAARL
ncbi:MAG: S-formylglutathione hydrolase [Myxococcota bacterium]